MNIILIKLDNIRKDETRKGEKRENQEEKKVKKFSNQSNG